MFAKTSVPLTALTAGLLMSTSALAADAEAFAERLKAVAGKQNFTLTYDSAVSEGDNVILQGVSGAPTGESAEEIGDVTFENVTGSTADGWRVERIPVQDIDVTEDGMRTTISGISIEGVELLPEGARSDMPAVKQVSELYFDRAGVESVTVEKDGKQVFDLSGVKVENSIADDGTFSSDMDLGTFNVDFTTADPEAAKTMTELGYETLTGTIKGSSSWDPTSGSIDLDPFEIDVENVGNLSFTFDMSGYTPAFIQSMQQISQQMAQNPEGNQNSGMAMMGLMSQLSIGSADLTFTDDSLTNKLLDYYAGQQGQTREQLVQMISGMAPMMLAQLQNPEFQQKVNDAVSSFLQDPQSISISIDPESPVPAMQIVGAAMGAPQTLPQVLSLDVTANEADE